MTRLFLGLMPYHPMSSLLEAGGTLQNSCGDMVSCLRNAPSPCEPFQVYSQLFLVEVRPHCSVQNMIKQILVLYSLKTPKWDSISALSDYLGW